ncbi:NACHT domain-containing protein [Annulohypoxylon moriforme]|nr:NACHT domain-containing protein [Annulohypoxylon moriforme]
MSNNIYHITASDNSFVNTGHTYQSEGAIHQKLLNLLLPGRESSESLSLYWDQRQARQRHVDETGKWLHDVDSFKSWLVEKNSFLWLRGIAGSGKTVLSSTVVDHLRSLKGNNHVAGYYFNAREAEKRRVSRSVRSLLLQLCPAEGNLPDKVKQLLDMSLREISDAQLLEALKDLIKREEQIYIVIDALDECDTSFESSKEAEDEKLGRFIHWLTSIDAPNLHLLVTSRENGLTNHLNEKLRHVLEGGIQGSCCGNEINLQAIGIRDNLADDIGKFIDSELKRWNNRKDRRWLPLDNSKHSLIAISVKYRANGMFRLAACLLDLLRRKEEWGGVEEALNGLPSELSGVYNRIFQDINDQRQLKTATTLLRWLLYSERPLTLGELTELTMIDGQGVFTIERRAKNRSYVPLTLSSFIVISNDLVQFAYQTVKEYLSNEGEYGFFQKPDS